MHTPTESTEPTKPTERQSPPPPVTYADHWHRHLANITDANEGIARTRNAGMRLLRRLMAGRFEASNNQLAAAKFTTALKFIALPKLTSTRGNRCSAHSTPRTRKPRNNSDTESDFTSCASSANCVNCDQCDHCADCEACDAAPPVPPEPPEPPKPIDPAEIPALIAEIKRINVDISDWTCQLGWDRENIELAKDPRVADFIRHQAENTEFKVLPGLRKELAAAEDRLAKSIAMRDALAAGATTEQAAAAAANATAANTSLTSAITTNATNATNASNTASTTNTTPTAATKPTTYSTTPDPLTTISAEAAFIDDANYKITQCRAIAARSTKPDEIDYYTKLADEIARDDLAPAQARLAAAQALLQPANPTHAATATASATNATSATATATTTAASATSSAQPASSSPAPAATTSSSPAATPAATPTTEPALPTDPAAIEREAAALKAEWQELDYARLDIHEELTTLERRKRHESHTPSWAAQAQDLINRCIAGKLNPTVWRQYHITQRLAQLGHKLE